MSKVLNKKNKHIFVTWLGVYPTITLILFAIEPYIHEMPMPVVTFIVTALAVPMLAYWVLPFLERTFQNWMDR